MPTPAKKFAQHCPSSSTSAKKLAQQAEKHQFWGVFSALGELFRARTHIKPRGANYFAPKLLAARQDETVNTNAGSSARLRETHDAFAHQDSTENGCFCLAMVPSVSLETEHSQAKVMTVSHSCRPHRLVTAQAGSPKSRT